MPYIEKDKRERLDWIVDNLVSVLTRLGITGNLNYFLFRLCKKYMEKNGESYTNYSRFIAELNECKAEIRRRYLADYEDKKINENGDV